MGTNLIKSTNLNTFRKGPNKEAPEFRNWNELL